MSAETAVRERARLGLDRPLGEQYIAWLSRLVRFDLGTSFRYARPVSELVGERAANTALLALAALLLATGIGVPLGVVSGSRRAGPLASTIQVVSVVGLSLPPLLTSILLALLAARTGWFPIGGMTSVGGAELSGAGRLVDLAWHLVLPVVALALPIAATLERLLARSMRETLDEPFILAALARGIPRRRVVWRHALRVADLSGGRGLRHHRRQSAERVVRRRDRGVVAGARPADVRGADLPRRPPGGRVCRGRVAVSGVREPAVRRRAGGGRPAAA